MEQTTAPPPLTATTIAGISTATTTAHPSSVESSPRSRTTDSWVEDTSPYPNPNPNNTSTAAPVTKLRLMCSTGGHIVPRPHDKSLCYVGGDTRIVVVDRHTTLSDLTNRLTKSVLRSTATTSFTIKYQLPNEDLDSLISITTDEDLENMIDEYDRLNNLNVTSSSRIRLFLFPVKPESVSSLGSVLESATKSEDWFLNMLNGNCSGNGNGNGMSSGFSDTTSVNGLLGLEDDVPVPEKKDVSGKGVAGRGLRGNNSVQDVQSVPDSPMLGSASSFGSASSTPSLANVPPVTVSVDDQVNVKCHEDVNFVAEPVPVVVIDDPNPKPKPSMDSVSSDGKPPVIYQDPAAHAQFATNNVIDQNTRIQIQQQVKDSSYLLSTPAAQPARVDAQNHQMHHQPQFIHTAVPPPQYLHHHPSGVVPMASYYQIYPSQTQYHAPHSALDQRNLVYYMPARQPPQGYNLPLQADASPAVSVPPDNQVPPPSGLTTAPLAVQSAAKMETPTGVYRTAANPGAAAPQLVQVPSSHQQMQPQFVGYSHVPQPSQLVASGGSGGNYVYEFADPSSHQQMQPQFVGYSHVPQPSQPVASGGSGGNYVYEFGDPSQQGQRMYYAAQPLPPQSAAQYQNIASTLPVEAQGGSHMNQQVRTSQP